MNHSQKQSHSQLGLQMSPVEAQPRAAAFPKYKESELGQRCFDWVVLIAKITERYPAHERHLLARKTRETAWQILRSYRDSKDAKERGKLPFLYAMDKDLQFIKLLFREASELKYLRDKKYREIIGKSLEVGALLGGMLNKYDPKRSQ